ncbi:MAG: putative inorganic carbon transporter subunit DabA, partial [bacterium]
MAHVLPAQGPLSVFIHHNPLHAFEELPFEQAVVAAARTLGRKAFLPEERYREELSRGRITEADVATVLDEDLGARGRELVGGVSTRSELRRRLALHGIPEARGAPLDWILGETAVLRHARPLWQSCLDAVERSDWEPVMPAVVHVRPRDRLLAAGGADLDEWIHPVLIRFVAAY